MTARSACFIVRPPAPSGASPCVLRSPPAVALPGRPQSTRRLAVDPEARPLKDRAADRAGVLDERLLAGKAERTICEPMNRRACLHRQCEENAWNYEDNKPVPQFSERGMAR